MPTLDWLNRADAFTTQAKVPYRLLEQVSVHASCVRAGPVEVGGIHDNLLIQGDNLEALKALIPFYRGQVKCIFIDPPYNTKSAFEHYDDNLEHAQWLSMMLPRLQLLRELLREDGSIWVTLDDNEAHYMKVLGDEVFGRQNFIIDLSWQKRDGPPNDRKIGLIHDHILIWAKRNENTSKKTLAEEAFNLMERTEKADSQYKVFDEPDGPDARGAFRKIDTTANGKGGRFVESLYYGVLNPYSGQEVFPRRGTCWRHNKTEMARLQADKRLYWGVSGTATTPMRKLFKSEAKQGMSSPSLWTDVGLNQHASAEIEQLFGEKASFETPKPESLMQRILHIASSEGDLVLDSFLGSGTTAAVAHKMGRRWIGIEMGEHAATHCLPRLVKVINGEQGGISKAVGWGVAADGGEWRGGGFRFMRLGETIFDDAGRINPAVRFATLAAFIWQQETGTAFDPTTAKPGTPYLGTYYIINSYSCTVDEGHRPISLVIQAKTPQLEPKFSIYLLFNGILGDKRPASGNVLTRDVLAALLALHAKVAPANTPIVVYGESVRVGPARLAAGGVTFKQIPYDVRAR